MDGKSIRKPAVAGTFYSSTTDGLRQQLEWCFMHRLGPGAVPSASIDAREQTGAILGLVSPHAGYMYSGPIAAHGFHELARGERPATAFILGPNHRGFGASIAIDGCDAWQTPLGEVALDSEAVHFISQTVPDAQVDKHAHTREHSIEVQVPFLQLTMGDIFRIVPIAMQQQDLPTSMALGKAIAAIAKDRKVVVIASTDLSHYELRGVAAGQDGKAIESILRLDAKELFEVVHKENISMCGPGPVAATITACLGMGARAAQLLGYATSSDVSGDTGVGVGYASIQIA